MGLINPVFCYFSTFQYKTHIIQYPTYFTEKKAYHAWEVFFEKNLSTDRFEVVSAPYSLVSCTSNQIQQPESDPRYKSIKCDAERDYFFKKDPQNSNCIDLFLSIISYRWYEMQLRIQQVSVEFKKSNHPIRVRIQKSHLWGILFQR